MIKKLIRSLQSELPFAKGAKDSLYFWSRRLLRRPHESQFRAISLLPDGCYLDVGANQGQSIESIRLFKPDAEIIAFEPNPDLAALLRARYRSCPNILVHGFGLADVASEVQLYIPSYKGFTYDALASFDRDVAESWISPNSVYWFRPDKLRLNQHSCYAKPLDALHLDPVFIKIDVEGCEYQVLQGGKETLLRCSPVLMIEDPTQESRQLLDVYGYQEQVFDGSRFRPGVTTTEGPNAFFTRSPLIEKGLPSLG
ncbi:MAG TPA: FkbM family methyltransferase [Rhodopila sp.]